MEPMSQIERALALMDPSDDSLWTQDGLPRVEVVAAIMGVPMVTRAEITEAAPEFNRATAAESFGSEANDEAEDEQDAEQEPEAEPEREPEPAADLDFDEDTIGEVDLSKILRSPELCHKAQRVLDAKGVTLRAKRDEVDRELAAVNTMSDVVARQIDRMTKSDPNAAIKAIRHYQQRSGAARAKRVLAAKARLGDEDAAALLAELDPRAPIDRALNARRGTPGTQRPTSPTPSM